MSMSKKDYEVIAAILRTNYNVTRHEDGDILDPDGVKMLDRIADSMADAFKRDNVRFQRDLFLDAVTPGWHRADRGMPKMKRSVTRVHAQRPQPEGV